MTRFNADNAPYHWDVQMGGTQLANSVGAWWCARDARARRPPSPGRRNPPTNDIRQKTRVLGVVSTDDPENKSTVEELDAVLKRTCGAEIGSHRYFYEPERADGADAAPGRHRQDA